MRDSQSQLPVIIGCGVGCLVLVIVAAIAIVIFAGVGVFTAASRPAGGPTIGYTFEGDNRFVTALPDSATNVQSEAVDLFPEYRYYMKAAMPEADFAAYTAKVEVAPHTPDRDYSDDIVWLGWPASVDSLTPSWWDASRRLDDTYVRQEGGSWVLVKYEGGFVYVYAFGH